MSPVRPRALDEVAPGVLVATSRFYATTSTAVLDGQRGALVVDPAWDPDELAGIPRALADRGVSCIGGVATHEHYDHVLWHPDLGDAPRWATPRTVEDLENDRERLLAPLKAFLTPDLIELAGRLDPLVDDLIPWSGPQIRVIAHDAHAPGHLALLIEEGGVLLAGDMLSDIELPMPAAEDTTLDTYLAGLERLRPAAEAARFLVPGHGSPTDDPAGRVAADLRYLDDLVAGRPSADPRVADPENAKLHQANLARAAAMR